MAAEYVKFNKHNPRIEYLDIAKGILILLVIFDHLPDVFEVVLNQSNTILHEIDNSQWVFKCFFMPAFFVITGMCSNFKLDFKNFTKKNFKSLIIPNVVLYTFCTIIPIMQTQNVFSDIIRIVKDAILYGGHYWFLSALFASKQIYWMLCRMIDKQWLISLVALLMIPVGFVLSHYIPFKYDIWYLSYALPLTFFLDLGKYLKRHEFEQYYGWCLVAFVPLVLMGLGGVKLPEVAKFYNCNWYDTPMYVLSASLGSVTILYVAKQIRTSFILQFLGRHTLILYTFQILVLTHIEKIVMRFIEVDSMFSVILFILITTVFTVFTLCILAKLLNMKFLRWSLGKF